MWSVIAELGVCDEMQNLLHELYRDLVTTIFFNNAELNRIEIAAGIKQGCPLSGTCSAIAVDPLVRAHLANITLRSFTICLFADDVALVLRCLRTQLGPLLAQMAAWHRASGRGLKMQKCVIIMLYGLESDYATIIGEHSEAAGMRVARAATYLGVEVGPDGHMQQWHTVSKNMSARVPDITAAPSLPSRIVLFNSYISSLYSFKAQFAGAPGATRREYGRAVQLITKAPWQALPTHLLTKLKGLTFPVEVRDIAQLTFEAQVRALMRSRVWGEVLTLVDQTRDSDDARLDGRCPWADKPIITTLRRTQAILLGMPREMRDTAAEGSNKKFLELLQRRDGGREEVILSVLAARARRWTITPDALVASFLKLTRTPPPPPELIASSLRTLVHAWCTSSRFTQGVKHCHFCQAPDCDRQHHCLACHVVRRWIGDRFGIAAQPGDCDMHAWLLGELGGHGQVAMRAAVILDAALFAFDAVRNPVEADANSLLGARLKEARRRHPQARAVELRLRRTSEVPCIKYRCVLLVTLSCLAPARPLWLLTVLTWATGRP